MASYFPGAVRLGAASRNFEGEVSTDAKSVTRRLVVNIRKKSFRSSGGEMNVLQNLKLEAKPGEFVCLTGPSGCGKSTLLRIIAGLDSDYDGEVFFGGECVTSPGRERGLVFQESRLLPWKTVEENVAFAVPVDRSPVEGRELVSSALRLIGMEEAKGLLPHQLSGGMEKRAALARAIASLPELLLLDEPFGALDFYMKIAIQDSILRIQEQHHLTAVMVTHDVEEAVYLGDRILILSARPCSVAISEPIEIDRPRERASDAFRRKCSRVLNLMSSVR